MAKSKLKLSATALRRKGKSIHEIVQLLHIPLSTASYWCRNITLSRKQQERLVKMQRSHSYAGRLKALEVIRERRLALTKQLRNEGMREIGILKEREFFLIGLGLYWGEGYRRQEKIGFTSSDPNIVRFIILWMKKFFQAKNSDFILRVSVNIAHKDRIRSISRYWSRTTHVPLSNFTKPSFINAQQKKTYPSRGSYYGTLRIILRKSTARHRKLMGWIRGVEQNIHTE